MVGLQRHQFGEIVLNDILLMKLLVLYDALLDFRYLIQLVVNGFFSKLDVALQLLDVLLQLLHLVLSQFLD